MAYDGCRYSYVGDDVYELGSLSKALKLFLLQPYVSVGMLDGVVGGGIQ